MRRILSIILAAMLIFSLVLPVTASDAVENGDSENILLAEETDTNDADIDETDIDDANATDTTGGTTDEPGDADIDDPENSVAPTTDQPEDPSEPPPPEFQLDKDANFALDRVLVKLSGDAAMSVFSQPAASNRMDLSMDLSVDSGANSGLDLGVGYTEMRLLNPSAEVAGISPFSSGRSSSEASQTGDDQNNVYVIVLEETGVDAVERALAILDANPAVEYAQPDYIYELFETPNDPSFTNGSLWGLTTIKAPDAWGITTGSKNVVVGIVDTGIDGTHPDLKDNLWVNPPANRSASMNDIHGYDFTKTGTAGGGTPYDVHYHGTHVAGTVGAKGNNNTGVVGVNWNVSLAWLGVFYRTNESSDDNLTVRSFATTSSVIFAINYAKNHGIPILNNSYGGSGKPGDLLEQEIRKYGGLFIAAAGNDNSNNDANPTYPASYKLDNIIAVASTDKNNDRSSFSNYGSNSVHIAAPGSASDSDILSTMPQKKTWFAGYAVNYAYLRGTSMAAPHVAGVAALMLAVNPSMTAEQLKEIILDTASPATGLKGFVSTGGILNAHAAVQKAARVPSAPQSFTATVGDSQISLSWSAPSSIGGSTITGYQVSSDGGKTWVNLSVNARSHTFRNLTNGTSYTFMVRAVNAYGNGSSASASATPNEPIPAFVTRLYIEVLGKNPADDEAGVTDLVNGMASGSVTGANIAFSFFLSPEMENNYAAEESAHGPKAAQSWFVDKLYVALLDRQPDAKGKAGWLTIFEDLPLLGTKMPSEAWLVVQRFVMTDEYLRQCNAMRVRVGDVAPQGQYGVPAFVDSLYQVFLGRRAEPSGLNSWSNALLNGTNTGTKTVESIIFEQRYREYLDRIYAKYPTERDPEHGVSKANRQYVLDLYLGLYSRVPGGNEQVYVNHFAKIIDDATARASPANRQQAKENAMQSVLRAFTSSQEFADLCAKYNVRR